MKVKDLIEKLKQCDQEAIVRISVYDGGDYMVPVGDVYAYDLTKSVGHKVVDLGE